MRTDPRIFDDFVGFELCHGGLPKQSIPCLEIMRGAVERGINQQLIPKPREVAHD